MSRTFRSGKGYWLGKAFRKTGPSQGEGYNQFRSPIGKIVRMARFAIEIGTSLIDGKPAFMIYYGAYEARLQNHLDEIRKLDDSIYVAVASDLAGDGTRDWRSVFLVGPICEWVGGAAGSLVPGFHKPVK